MPYIDFVLEAISHVHHTHGASRTAIANWICTNKGKDHGPHFNAALRSALKSGLANGQLKQGTTAQRFKLGKPVKKTKTAKKAAKKKVSKKKPSKTRVTKSAKKAPKKAAKKSKKKPAKKSAKKKVSKKVSKKKPARKSRK